MRNRWFHKPLFHIKNEAYEKKASWLELFYDLIFVAAFIQLGNGLSEHISLDSFFRFSGVFISLWVIWTGFTTFMNRFTLDDFLHRALVFIQMFMVGGMALSAPMFLSGNHVFFCATYAVAQGCIAIFFFRAFFQQKLARNYSLYWGQVFAIGSALWFLTCFIDSTFNIVCWVVATFVIFLAPFNKRSRKLQEMYPTDQEHLSERLGLLTIIVLGESFVKVLPVLASKPELTVMFIQASLTLLLICCIWWIYFDDVASAELKNEKLNPLIWLYAHIPLQLSLIAIGVGIKKSLYLDLSAAMPIKYGWLLCGSLSLAFFSVAIIDSVTKRKLTELSDTVRVVVRASSGTMFLLLAAVNETFTAKWFLIIVLFIAVLQVIFDMAMAPLENSHMPDESVSTADIAKARQQNKTPAAVKKMSSFKIIRKGTPSEFNKDFYFFLMEGSWMRVLISFGLIYFVMNLFFAGLYVLRPGSIAAARPDSFIDAFFFSIQTMSTIGYGSMSPVTTYGHIVVTMEVLTGLVSVALLTGIIFAKASRPRSSIMFSKNLILANRHGKKYLMFRAGNARGNDIVDAAVELNLIVDDISPEGDHLRRIKTLKLERDKSPIFALSWSILHEIDENSPVYGVDFSKFDPNLISFIVTMTGHDGTYGQTVYARHFYYATDIKENVKFVDVINQMPDGRFMIDYSKFHDIEPIQTAS